MSREMDYTDSDQGQYEWEKACWEEQQEYIDSRWLSCSHVSWLAYCTELWSYNVIIVCCNMGIKLREPLR